MNKSGPLVNPPVPITKSGLNFFMIIYDCNKLKIIFKGIKTLVILKLRLIPSYINDAFGTSFVLESNIGLNVISQWVFKMSLNMKQGLGTRRNCC